MFFYVGKVYAVGGHDGNEHLGNMEVFDPLTNKWMMKASMNTKRYINVFENSNHIEILVSPNFKEKCFFRRGIALAALGGPIYAIGGLDDNSCFNDVERYDIESDTWSAVAPMNTPRGGVGSVALGVRLPRNQPSCDWRILQLATLFLTELRVRRGRQRRRGVAVQRGALQPPSEQMGGGQRDGAAAGRERRQQTQRLPLRRG